MAAGPLPLLHISHVSRLVADLEASRAFYRDVLGFLEIKRPSSFDFPGHWLMGFGTAVHLIKGAPELRPAAINPKGEHLSFQAANMAAVEMKLINMRVEYVKQSIMEDGILVSQMFFHDPDGNMIEVCDCDCLPVVLLDPVLHPAAAWDANVACAMIRPSSNSAPGAYFGTKRSLAEFYCSSNSAKIVPSQSEMLPLRRIAAAAGAC